MDHWAVYSSADEDLKFVFVHISSRSKHIYRLQEYKTFNQTLFKFSLLYVVNELKLGFEDITYKNVA